MSTSYQITFYQVIFILDLYAYALNFYETLELRLVKSLITCDGHTS